MSVELKWEELTLWFKGIGMDADEMIAQKVASKEQIEQAYMRKVLGISICERKTCKKVATHEVWSYCDPSDFVHVCEEHIDEFKGEGEHVNMIPTEGAVE